MLEPGTKFAVKYRKEKSIDCLCLAGRKFGQLMKTLTRLQKADQSETVDSDLFETEIPAALAICVGDKDKADELWDTELTLRDAIEIISGTVQKHIVGDDELGK